MRAFFTDCVKNRHFDTFPNENEIGRVARPDTIVLNVILQNCIITGTLL